MSSYPRGYRPRGRAIKFKVWDATFQYWHQPPYYPFALHFELGLSKNSLHFWLTLGHRTLFIDRSDTDWFPEKQAEDTNA